MKLYEEYIEFSESHGIQEGFYFDRGYKEFCIRKAKNILISGENKSAFGRMVALKDAIRILLSYNSFSNSENKIKWSFDYDKKSGFLFNFILRF
jgi:hypothetical protein